MSGKSAHSVAQRIGMMMNKIQVDAAWLERVTVDVSAVTTAVREIADQARAMKALLDDYKARELRVRELHKKDHHGYCTYCYTYMGTASFYPCPTIQALDSEA
jgi:hypothetical protein